MARTSKLLSQQERYAVEAKMKADHADSYKGNQAAGFSDNEVYANVTIEKINTDFGWAFKSLAKPTLEQLEEIKESL